VRARRGRRGGHCSDLELRVPSLKLRAGIRLFAKRANGYNVIGDKRMAQVPVVTEQQPLTLNVKAIGLTDEQFEKLCADNPELRLELTAERELVIMAPAGSKSGWRSGVLFQRLANWAEKDKGGITFDSSTGFALGNGAKRSPDASWMRRARWDSLTEEQQEAFAPLCPDFVAEIRSPSDSLPALMAKMREYLENGAQLGWLIDPLERNTYIYRTGAPEEYVDAPTILRGDPVLPHFVFDVTEIW